MLAVAVTTTAGQGYTGPTSGTVTIPANVVTGNGRSDASCADFHTSAGWSYFRVVT